LAAVAILLGLPFLIAAVIMKENVCGNSLGSQILRVSKDGKTITAMAKA
jgi:hypothetical protein